MLRIGVWYFAFRWSTHPRGRPATAHFEQWKAHPRAFTGHLEMPCSIPTRIGQPVLRLICRKGGSYEMPA
jgi:hypothetical protein